MSTTAGALTFAEQLLERIVPVAALCRDRRVVLVCPGPAVTLPADIGGSGEIVYAVNGGLGVARASNCLVHLWQVNGRADRSHFRIEPTPLRQRWLDHAQDLHVPGLILFHRDVEGYGTFQELRARGASFGWITEILKKYRAPLLYLSGIGDEESLTTLQPSAGIMALCLILLAGATSVVVCGMGWQPGYAYLPAGDPLATALTKRGHVPSDQFVLSRLQRYYAHRDITSTAADLHACGIRPAAVAVPG